MKNEVSFARQCNRDTVADPSDEMVADAFRIMSTVKGIAFNAVQATKGIVHLPYKDELPEEQEPPVYSPITISSACSSLTTPSVSIPGTPKVNIFRTQILLLMIPTG